MYHTAIIFVALVSGTSWQVHVLCSSFKKISYLLQKKTKKKKEKIKL